MKFVYIGKTDHHLKTWMSAQKPGDNNTREEDYIYSVYKHCQNFIELNWF